MFIPGFESIQLRITIWTNTPHMSLFSMSYLLMHINIIEHLEFFMVTSKKKSDLFVGNFGRCYRSDWEYIEKTDVETSTIICNVSDAGIIIHYRDIIRTFDE